MQVSEKVRLNFNFKFILYTEQCKIIIDNLNLFIQDIRAQCTLYNALLRIYTMKVETGVSLYSTIYRRWRTAQCKTRGIFPAPFPPSLSIH